jgi:hypothetical protein
LTGKNDHPQNRDFTKFSFLQKSQKSKKSQKSQKAKKQKSEIARQIAKSPNRLFKKKEIAKRPDTSLRG